MVSYGERGVDNLYMRQNQNNSNALFIYPRCGPCQFMSPQFKDAAKEFGPDVRMVKLDSDKYPRIASALKVGGLPTVILFDGGDVSKEIDRIEGALTKDQLVGFVRKHLS